MLLKKKMKILLDEKIQINNEQKEERKNNSNKTHEN